MKIGFDGKRAVQNFTGLGNYSRYAIEALLEYKSLDAKYVIYAPKNKENPRLHSINSFKNVVFKFPKSFLCKKLKSLWRVWFIKKDISTDEIDIFHGLSNELPLSIRQCKSTKSIVTIHDLIFLKCPKCYHFIDRIIYNYKYRKSCENADLIIAVSECTKKDIIELYGIPADKIKVIYQGCDDIFTKIESDEKRVLVRNKYSLPEKYLLFVGSIEERKNALTIVKSLNFLPQDIYLVLIGKHTPYTDKIIDYIKENNLIDRVKILHDVPFRDLSSIYQLASTFVYPSIYEGFGIPIIEALNSRVPVVAANGSCLEEAGGPDSLYVSPYDEKAMAEAIKQTFIEENRVRMVENGILWAKKFNKEKFAKETYDCYRSLSNMEDSI